MTERGPKGEPGKENKENLIYHFSKGTFIYWDSGASMGTTQSDLEAVRLPGKAKRQLFQYQVTSLWSTDVYYDGRTRSIGYGSTFRAYTPKGKPHQPR